MDTNMDYKTGEEIPSIDEETMISIDGTDDSEQFIASIIKETRADYLNSNLENYDG